MPPARMLSIAADLLEHVASGAADAETADLLAALRMEGERSEDPLAAERLLAQLASHARYSRESALADRGLNLLIETAHDLSSTLSLQDLLRKIVSRARSLVSADIAWLTIRDEQRGLFRNIAAEGHLSPGTARMTSRFDHGAVSLIMNTKTFFTTSNYLADDRFPHSAALDRQFGIENIESLAGLPAFSGDIVQGLLFVADRYSRQYSGREISVLGSFAQHAGMAMRNARTFERLSEALEETERNRSALESHVRRVEASAQTHDEMMSLLAQGADLSTFMRRMAGHIGGSIQYLDSSLVIRQEVTSEDYDGSLSDELRQGGIDQAKIVSALVRSRENGRSVLLYEKGHERCLVLALHGGTVRGDSLIVCHTGRLDEIHLRNLERSAVALSIAKLWTERRETERLIASSTLLRHLVLVSPTDASTVASVRDRLGLGNQQPVRMALIILSGLERDEQTAQIREVGGRLNILLDLVDSAYFAVGPLKEIDKLIEGLRRRTGSGQIGGLISRPYCDLAESPGHYARLGNALRTMERIAPLTRFIGEAEIGLFARLFEGGDPRRIQEFVRNTLTPIAARDPRNRAQLKATLLCYFDCQFNIARAAEELGIHVNTMRRRLGDAAGGDRRVGRSDLSARTACGAQARRSHLGRLIRPSPEPASPACSLCCLPANRNSEIDEVPALEAEHPACIVGRGDLQIEIFDDGANLPHLLGVGFGENAPRDVEAVLEPDTDMPLARGRMGGEGHLVPAGRQHRPLIGVAEQPIRRFLHEEQVRPFGPDAAQNAEDRLNQERRLDDLAVQKVGQVVEMADVVAFVLEPGAVVLAERLDDAFDVLEGIAENAVLRAPEIGLFPIVLPVDRSLGQGMNREIHRTHVERAHFGLEAQRPLQALLKRHLEPAARGQIDDRVARFVDLRQELGKDVGLRRRRTRLRIARVKMQDRGSRLGRLDRRTGDLVRCDGKMRRHGRRVDAAGNGAADDDFLGTHYD